MNDKVEQWLSEQQAQRRQLLLVIDSLAEPAPLPRLFSADLVQEYANLYQGTEVGEMASIGPWLIVLNELNLPKLSSLTDVPEQNWGWLASTDHAHTAILTGTGKTACLQTNWDSARSTVSRTTVSSRVICVRWRRRTAPSCLVHWPARCVGMVKTGRISITSNLVSTPNHSRNPGYPFQKQSKYSRL